jgi:hypothetical protein
MVTTYIIKTISKRTRSLFTYLVRGTSPENAKNVLKISGLFADDEKILTISKAGAITISLDVAYLGFSVIDINYYENL